MEFKSDRYFTVFDFFISHSQLLIRSSKNDENKSNIDIVFFDVKFIQLGIYYNGLRLKLRKGDIPPTIAKEYLTDEECNLFEIESKDEKAYVIAGLVHIYENSLDFNESSLGVLQYKGRDTLILNLSL